MEGEKTKCEVILPVNKREVTLPNMIFNQSLSIYHNLVFNLGQLFKVEKFRFNTVLDLVGRMDGMTTGWIGVKQV